MGFGYFVSNSLLIFKEVDVGCMAFRDFHSDFGLFFVREMGHTKVADNILICCLHSNVIVEELIGNSICSITFFVLFLCLVMLAAYLWIANKNLRRQVAEVENRFEQIKKEQDEILQNVTNKEIALKIMEPISRNNLIRSLKIKIKKVREKFTGKDVGVIDGLVIELSKHEETRLWLLFEKKFSAAYPTFFKNLKKDYADLTLADLKICALVRVGITTKDMAEIVNVGFKTAEAIRTKLRRTFELEHNESLGEFLQKY
ncbi:helix-turn-helix transcriptional regulator [Alistipes sp. ZOR0009]|uniref:helix-turn-helix transcriptional regulator n=1 Tax=Alistipes sp. ZOR0009 TaxID=1339253 RepID=UPI000A54FC99|nr:hypothetical protein [Alistipes sp. ZOR0009]